MASAEEKKDLSAEEDDGSLSADSESNVEAEGQPENSGTAGTDTFSEGQATDSTVAEATIIPEDDTEPSGSVGPEDTLEDRQGSTGASPEQEVEEASPDASAPEAAEVDRAYGSRCRFKKYQTAIGGVVTGTCVSLLVYGLWCLVASPDGEHIKVPSTQVYWASVEGDATILSFAKFLILPARENDKAYLLFSVSAKPSNSTVYKEINEKRTICRSAIYRVVRKTFRAEKKEMVTNVKLMQQIMDVLNGILDSETVDWIGFTSFSTV